AATPSSTATSSAASWSTTGSSSRAGPGGAYPRRVRRSDDLARVEDPGRGESALHGGVEGEDGGAELGRQAGPLQQADAMLAARVRRTHTSSVSSGPNRPRAG